jgi:hypothetical protein
MARIGQPLRNFGIGTTETPVRVPARRADQRSVIRRHRMHGE